MQNRFDDLPNEVLMEIAEYLDADHAGNTAQAYPQLDLIISDLWRRRCDRHFPRMIADYEREHIKDWVAQFKQIESRVYEHLLPKLHRLFYFAKEQQFAPITREPLQINNLLATDTQNNSLLSLCTKSKNQPVLDYFYKIAIAFFTVNNNIDLDKVDNNGNSLLHWAIFCRQSADTIYALLDYGFDINKLSAAGKTPLMIAAEHSTHHVKLLLDLEADMSVINSSGKDALLIAVENDEPEIIEMLIRYGADLNQPIYNQITREKPCVHAAKLGCIRALHALAKHENIDVEVVFTGKKLLHIAVENNQMKTVRYLLANHADIDAADISGATPLHEALKCGNDEIALELINNGANLNAAMKNKTKPLYLAVNCGRTAMVAELLKRHADIRKAEQNNLGLSMLYVAAMNGRADIVKVLLEHGVDINHTTAENKSALYIASKNGHQGVVKVLLEHCANPNISSVYGLTPLHVAARAGNLEIIKLLLKFHALTYKRTNVTNKTAYMLAEEHGHIEAANEINKQVLATQRYLKRKLPPAQPYIDIGQAFNESAILVDAIPPRQFQRNSFWHRQQPPQESNDSTEDESRYIIDL